MARKVRRGSDYQDLRRKLLGNKATQEENVIPMINVVFLLLMYFMVAGNLQPDYNVTPPFSTQLAEPPPQIPTLSVSQDGSLRFENRATDLERLQAELSAMVGHEKLKIHADAKVEALTISQIMKTAADAGILQFVLITQRRPAAG